MNTVAAFLLTVLDEMDAFWMLAFVIEDILPPHFYARNLVGLRAEVRVVRICTASNLPALNNHIAAYSLLEHPRRRASHAGARMPLCA